MLGSGIANGQLNRGGMPAVAFAMYGQAKS
jgi:hypothetical protein